ncbi:MAG: phosphatidate cytidylyltransferase [Gemmatimonadota bacterium]|nr:MAG: phosphatidate cytidylyltransferase [Gemmatimonadota bacterium]
MDFFDELNRKLVHLSSLCIPIGIYFLPKRTCVQILFFLTILFLSIEILRMVHRPTSKIFYTFFGSILRRKERFTLTGSTTLLMSSLVCVLIFQKPIAVAALCFLIVGDTMAALVGKTFGRIKVFRKTIEGSLACLGTCIIIVLIVPPLDFVVGLIGAVVATLIELLPIPLDDNFLIPILSGAAMQYMLTFV